MLLSGEKICLMDITLAQYMSHPSSSDCREATIVKREVHQQ